VIFALLFALADPEARFLELLRTYPERPPAETFRQVAALIDEGDFAERDRAEYWIGSARLAAADRDGARQWFARLGRDYPDSIWAERSWLGLGDAAAQDHDYGVSLGWYEKAFHARDTAVRELARIDIPQVLTLRRRQRIAWAAGFFALCVAAVFAWQGRKSLWPLPAETRIVLPVLAVLSLLSVRIDAKPRKAVLMLTGGGAVLSLASAARGRGRGRLLTGALSLLALACLAYVAVYREDLIGMVAETFRAGPE
jgi:hypothetical protein